MELGRAIMTQGLSNRALRQETDRSVNLRPDRASPAHRSRSGYLPADLFSRLQHSQS